MFFSGLKCAVRLAVVLSLAWGCAARLEAQSFSPSPSDQDSAGSPAYGFMGSGYAQSSVESVNLYNGKLNVTIPILGVGGRGTAGYTMVVPIQRIWSVDLINGAVTPGSYADPFDQPDYPAAPYTPMTLVARHISGTAGKCTNGTDYGPYVTRLVITRADGSETVLLDTTYGGQAQGTTANTCAAVGSYSPVDRGKIFVSSDGSNLTFVADNDVSDSVNSGLTDGKTLAGTLYFPDGTQYRFGPVAGSIKLVYIQDRNGNQTSFSYNASSNNDVTATDPIGRTATVSSRNCASGSTTGSSGDCEPNYDTVTYAGYNGGKRVITINRNSLSAALASGGAENIGGPGGLFSEVSSIGVFNPEVVTSVVLPNGLSYSFLYNAYGELAQLTLPAGGYYKYIYQQAYSCSAGAGGSGGDGLITISNYAGKSVYRRLTERDEYSDGVNLSGKTTYHACANANLDSNHSSRAETTVLVDRSDAGSNLLRHEDHRFYGDPSAANSIAAPTAYGNWSDGLEFQTNIGETATTVRQSTQMVWTQRPCGASTSSGNAEDCWDGSPTADTAPLHDPQMCQVNTSLDGQSAAGQVFLRDQYNNVTDMYEFDYGKAPAVGAGCPTSPSGFTRHDVTAYNYGSSYVQQGTHIWNLPASVTIQDAASNPIAQQKFGYDESGVTTYGGVSGYAAPSGERGNVTTNSRWWNASYASASTASHAYLYDQFGNVIQDTDPKGNVSTVSYSDGTYANPTSITSASGTLIAQTVGLAYDYSTGAVTQFTDINGFSTTYAYGANDSLDRLTSITYPDGGSSSISYAGLTQMTRTDAITGSQAMTTTADYDGLGRPKDVIVTEVSAGSSSTSTGVFRTYDALGRTLTISDPQRYTVTATQTPARGICAAVVACETFAYDSLNRVTSVTGFDGLVSTASFVGNVVTVTDQAQNTRQYFSDGLGRLSAVIENSSAAAVADSSTAQLGTSYGYNLLDQIISVTQSGQTRTFSYDSLGQLYSSSQPEYTNASGGQGAVTFAYDADGNLMRRTDSNGKGTCYAYDQLNRPTSTVYYLGTQTGACSAIPASAYDAHTSAVSYQYGTAAGASYGQLTQVSNGNSVTSFTSFDSMGRVLNSTQVTGGQVFPFSYTYNLAGGLSAETYPSGRTVTMGYDNANRPNLAQGSLSGQTTNYVSSVGYWPNSAPQTMAYGNGLTRSFTFNARNQPTQIMDASSAGTLLQLNLGWGDGAGSASHNIGRLRSQQISAPGLSFTQSYLYDPLKRLQSITDTAAGTTLQRSFNYDPYGNSWLSQNDNGLPYNSLTPVTASSYGANNRITLPTAGYDQMGNQTVSGSYVYSYDSENRVYLANDTVAPVGFLAMFYDGLGQRIQKQLSSGAITTYVYDAFGQLADEYSNFSVPSSCSTCYLSTDHLGSTRLVTDGGGNVMTRHDFMPFGDEITGMGRSSVWGSSADGVTQKFTGQQRDEGQGLDFFNARYFYSALGRFTSPDPMSAGADPAEPQTWNGYAYVANDPMSQVDPDGMGACGGAQLCVSGSSSSGATTSSTSSSSGFQWGLLSFQWGGGLNTSAVNTIRNPSVNLAPDANQASLVSQFFAQFPIPSQSTMDRIAAFSDVFSFGASEVVGGWTGSNSSYNRSSNAYKGAVPLAMAASFFTGDGELSALKNGAAWLEPSLVRFSQNSISRLFGDGRTIMETVDALRGGEQIPEIRVFLHKGALYTLDNRRLLAASMAGVKIRARLATSAELALEFKKKFNPVGNGFYIEIRGRR